MPISVYLISFSLGLVAPVLLFNDSIYYQYFLTVITPFIFIAEKIKPSKFTKLLVSFGLGIFLSSLKSIYYHGLQLPDGWIKQKTTMTAQVDSLPEYRSNEVNQSQKFIVKVIDIEQESESVAYQYLKDKKIQLSWYSTDSLVRVGDIFQFTVSIKNPRGFLNEGSFKYRLWLLSSSVIATGYIKNAVFISNARNSRTWNHYRERLRYEISKKNNIKHADVLLAIIIGDRSLMSKSKWNIFQNTGTSHLISISGLHVGLISGFVYFVFNGILRLWLWPLRFFSRMSIAAFFSLAAAGIYAGLAGFSLPTQRALIMLLCFLSSRLFSIQISLLNRLLIALSLVLLLNPWSVYFKGIYLSFLSVILLCLSLNGQLKIDNKFTLAVKSQYYLFFLLMPLSLAFFSQLPLLSVVVNFFAIPFFGLIVLPLSFIYILMDSLFSGDLVSYFNPETILYLLDQCLNVLIRFIEFFSDISDFQLTLPNMHRYEFYVLLMLVFLYSLLKTKVWVLMYLLVFASLLVTQIKKERNPLSVSVLDVGQGLSVVVQTKTKTLLYDVGAAFPSGFNMAEAVILPYLYRKGVNHIDAVVLSHNDNDHAGSIEPLIEKISIDRLIVGDPVSMERVSESSKSVKFEICQRRQWRWDDVEFSIVYADPENSVSNDRSCVLRIQWKNHVVILPGDISKRAENTMLKEYSKEYLQSDILIAPHHGSQTSSGLSFVRAVAPKHVVFANGYQHQFKHPHAKVTARYKEIKSKLWRSDNNGAIEFSWDNKARLKVQSYSLEYRYYWDIPAPLN